MGHTAATLETSLGKPVLPPPESKTIQFSTRWPVDLVKEVDEIAKEAGHGRSIVLIHFVRWAVDEWKAEREAEKKHRK